MRLSRSFKLFRVRCEGPVFELFSVVLSSHKEFLGSLSQSPN